MTSKINVTENIAITIEKQNVEVATSLKSDISINFEKKEEEATLDENGELFEPSFRCKIKATPKQEESYTSLTRLKNNIKDLQEIKKFFDFVLENKRNLFDMADFKGVLE